MKISDAANILGVCGEVTEQEIKKAYRSAIKKYHPDVNPAGEEMTKVVNAAFAALKGFTGKIESDEAATYPEELNKALNSIIGLTGLVIEICGAWVWVSGETKLHKDHLKTAGFKYASKKKRWYFRPSDWSSRSRGNYSMEAIREKYGSDKPVAPRGFYLKSNKA